MPRNQKQAELNAPWRANQFQKCASDHGLKISDPKNYFQIGLGKHNRNPINEGRLENSMGSFLGLLYNRFLDQQALENSYRFCVAGFPHTFGYISPRIRDELVLESDLWDICDSQRRLTIRGASVESRTANVLKTLASRTNLGILGLTSISEEVFPVYAPQRQIVVNIPRNAALLFGILAYGVQLVAYEVPLQVRSATQPASEFKIWISRRSLAKNYFPGLLDVTVSGALEVGELPLEGLLRESWEEASLPDQALRDRVGASGIISYVGKSGKASGGNDDMFILPEVDFCYDVGLLPGVAPTPMDGEVESFLLLTVSDIMDRLRCSEFSPSATCVLLDFLIKRGFITYENEPNYIEIAERLHYKLEHPMI